MRNAEDARSGDQSQPLKAASRSKTTRPTITRPSMMGMTNPFHQTDSRENAQRQTSLAASTASIAEAQAAMAGL